MTTFAKKSSKSRKVTLLSFTLIEILTVCALLAFLMAMMIGAYGLVTQKGAEAQCKATMEIIKTALESYKAKTGYYIQRPTSGDFIIDKPNATDLDFTEFINYEKMINTAEIELIGTAPSQGILIDPFGANYRYQCPGKHNRTGFDLSSAGADGKDGTAEEQKDDIKNWE